MNYGKKNQPGGHANGHVFLWQVSSEPSNKCAPIWTFGKFDLTENSLECNKKNTAAIREHFYQHIHQGDSSCFSLSSSATISFHLELKE